MASKKLNAHAIFSSSLLSCHTHTPRLKLTQYRPTRLDKLVFHSDIGEALQKLVTESGLGRKG